jgi:hypothetical protein
MIEKLIKPIFDKYEGLQDTEVVRLKMYYDLCKAFPYLLKFDGDYKNPNFLKDLFIFIAENSTEIMIDHRNKIIDSITYE